ncbi:Dabb family protein [Candidatus Kapabacteria bacterium]|nr:Dabb family protein [Candidatus Kapabacteria bacterium]
MIKHIVMLKFYDGVKLDIIKKIKKQMDEMPSEISQIKSFETGINISKSHKAFDLILVSEFENDESLQEYIVHPVHQNLIAALDQYREKSHVVDYQIE